MSDHLHFCKVEKLEQAYNTHARIELKNSFMTDGMPKIKNGCACRKSLDKVNSRIVKKERCSTAMPEKRTCLASTVLKYLKK